MKIILICAALTATVSPTLHAQNAPNRDGGPELPGDVPARPEAHPPAATDHGKTTSDADGPGKSADQRFIQNAGKAGIMEVKLAEYGIEKLMRKDLKVFAAMVVTDHKAANGELGMIAKSMGVEIPEPSKGDHTKTGEAAQRNEPSGGRQSDPSPGEPKKPAGEGGHSLEGKTGIEFDNAFMAVMKECHAKDIALFEKSQGEVKSPELEGFIGKTLPVLKKHAAALAALERLDPNRPDAETGSPAPAAGNNPSPGAPNPIPTPNR